MAKKENKGGILSNEDVEKELEIRGDKGSAEHPYKGSQDTGDAVPKVVEADRQQDEDTDRNDKV